MKNIIFIHTDSMDGRVPGYMGLPPTKNATPNLDRLAEEGTVFTNTYTNCPVCCPSRASMWRGQYVHNTGGYNNYKGIENTDGTFEQALNDGGYNCGYFGKTDYLSGRHSIRVRVGAWTRSAAISRASYYLDEPLVLEEPIERLSNDWKMADNCVDWLKNAVNQDKPFFLYAGVHLPHPSYRTSKFYLDKINSDLIEIPPRIPQSEMHPALLNQIISKGWRHGYSPEMVRLVRSVYYAMVAEADAVTGYILDSARKLGALEDTYVIFSSDHGEMNMEHDQYYKMNYYEPSARIPLIISGPGIKRGQRVESLCSLVDIFPTLMDMAGLPQLEGIDGESLMHEALGGECRRRDYVFGEFHDSPLPTGCFMVRRGDYKYIAYPGYEPQLFNVIEDKWEMNNLAQDMPEKACEMEQLLKNTVNYRQVDRQFKEEDRDAFREWREQTKADGTYIELMSKIFSGWDKVIDPSPWTTNDERAVEYWLDGK